MEEVEDIEETRQSQQPLFKLLNESFQQEGAKAPNRRFEDGKVLPKKLRKRFLQEAQPCVPLEEIDPYYNNKETFVVIGRWGTIHRFSCNPDGYLNMGPNNVFRRLAIYLLTNWIFSTLIVATLLLNIFALIKTQSFEIQYSMDYSTKKTWAVEAMYIVNWICLAIYCFELVLKIIARGLVGDTFTCLRDPWTWLDVVVIWTGFYYYYSFIIYRKSAFWLRLFKIIPLIPSIRQACNIAVRAVMKLRGMMILLVFLLWFFSILGLQMYMGTLTQKCIKKLPDGARDDNWIEHNRNITNWFHQDFDISLCGNSSGSRQCPDNYVCLQGFGPNPNFGQSNFDNIFWSLLSVIRIGSEDFTEEIYRQIVETNGPWHIWFFVAIFFIITYPMGCLFFGTLASFFLESKVTSDLEMEEVTGLEDVHDFDLSQNPESMVIKGKSLDAPEELVGFRKALHSFVFDNWTRYGLICVILVDIIGISSDYYGIQENVIDYRFFTLIIPYFVFLVYTVEFLLKIIALGPAKYFKNKWNVVDFIVLLTFFLEIQSYFGHYTGYMLAPIRMLKLIQYWPSLRMIFAIYHKTVKSLFGWILFSTIVFGFLVFIGPFEIGRYELEQRRGGRSGKVTPEDMPRFSFLDFWHSFRQVFRMQIAEWVETFWDCYRTAGSNCVLYYLAANLCGALLSSFLLVGLVYTTVKELQGNYHPSKDRGLRLLCRKACGLICSPIKKIQPKDMLKKKVADGSSSTENEAEDQALPKPKSKSERRKTSIVAESTGQLRKVMQDCTEHLAYKIACSFGIIVASLAMILETESSGEGMQTALFVIEIMFTVIFFVVSIYEFLSFGFKESLTNRGWLFDSLIVLEMILNLSVYGFSVSGMSKFRVGMFCIRSLRPLMLICRIGWLKAPFVGLKYELKMMWETVLAILFIWLAFDNFAVHWLNGRFYKCLEVVSGEEIAKSKVECLASNHSWTNSDFHFDNARDGFINMVFLASRMGWVSITQDASDAVEIDHPRQKEFSKMWFFYFVVFILTGALGALGILFSYVYNKFQQDDGYRILLTENQVDIYTETKTSRKQTGITLEEEYIPAPDSPCLLSFYNFVTNVKFDAFVMSIIILDNVALSLDHYMMDHTFEMVIAYINVTITFLYLVEMIVKMIAWGKHYFRNAWNWLDLFVVLFSILGLILTDLVEKYFFSPTLLRMLRLCRIFRFLLAKKYGSLTAKILLSAASNMRHAFTNLLLFQLTWMWAFAVLGNYLFKNVKLNWGMNDVLNFQTFGSAFRTLTILLGFPCLDGLYLGMSNEADCERADFETKRPSNCGNKTAAVYYLGLYAAITFSVLLNMYSVLIFEIVSEINRFKNPANTGDEDVPLRDVTIENGHQKSGDGTGGDVAEQTEDGDANSENGE